MKKNYPNAAAFRAELQRRFNTATENNWSTLIVRSGTLHDDVVISCLGTKKSINLMPSCCSIMWQEKGEKDSVIKAPPKRQGRQLIIEYDTRRPRLVRRTATKINEKQILQ